jgi:squalene-hopene/tetraprenyl-beta-curcumene cyclase
MGLCAFDDASRPSIQRGIQYLIQKQNLDGSWTEHETTGTGFPKVFYLKYDMYRNAWPLLALAAYRKILAANQAKTNGQANGKEHPQGQACDNLAPLSTVGATESR